MSRTKTKAHFCVHKDSCKTFKHTSHSHYFFSISARKSELVYPKKRTPKRYEVQVTVLKVTRHTLHKIKST